MKAGKLRCSENKFEEDDPSKEVRSGRRKQAAPENDRTARFFPPVTCFVKCFLFPSQSDYKQRCIFPSLYQPLRIPLRKFPLPSLRQMKLKPNRSAERWQ